MKKILFVLLVICMIVALSSCQTKQTEVTQQGQFSNYVKNAQTQQKTQPQQDIKAEAPQQTQEQTETEEDIFVKEFLFDMENAVKDSGKKSFSQINGFELTKAMVTGWNLGNTLEATGASGMPSETSWGQPHTEKAMIDGLAASGFKTIRIPVSWHNHIIDKQNYTISTQWMERIKTVVDWAIENDMYVIINSHHDNYEKYAKMTRASGYYPSSENLVESQRFLYNIWGQIATAFNNGYDEHLIFETMNEPRIAGTNCEWWYGGDTRCIDGMKCLLELNQTALDAIRSTGGNNAKRFVMCPSLQASENAASASTFKMPDDIEPGRLILSVHAYSPYSFAMESPGEKSFTQAHQKELKTMNAKLKKKFIDNGYPVVIGEYGATNKDNLEDRVAWFEFFLTTAKENGIPCLLWDNGVWQIKEVNGKTDYGEHYGYYNRKAQTWFFPEITETIISATK